ncbi:MAG TPA: hypothetical protein VNA04_10495 [Thermoanaerobaculia bacterium]|nr:hypothetical protein [Thermoanaerobaculia bacterium]
MRCIVSGKAATAARTSPSHSAGVAKRGRPSAATCARRKCLKSQTCSISCPSQEAWLMNIAGTARAFANTFHPSGSFRHSQRSAASRNWVHAFALMPPHACITLSGLSICTWGVGISTAASITIQASPCMNGLLGSVIE